MTLRSTLVAAALVAALPLAAIAQPAPRPESADLAAVREALGKDKRAYVAQTLGLTPAEAKRFWPVYESYQRQLDTTVRRRSRLVEEVVALDRPMTDAFAKRLAAEFAAIDDDETKDRRRMHNQVLRALPPAKALVYLQVENKVRAIRAYDVAAVMPLGR